MSADDALAGASVVVDGRHVGDLQHLVTHRTFLEWLLKQKAGNSPAFHFVALNVDARTARLTPGKHVIQVEKSGHPVASGEFEYPFDHSFAFFVVSESRVEQVNSGEK